MTLKLLRPREDKIKMQNENNNPIYTQVRIDERTFYRAKILAAVYNESFNKFMLRAIRNELDKYESEYGKLPEAAPQTSAV